MFEISIKVSPQFVSVENYDDVKARGEVPWVLRRIASVCCPRPDVCVQEHGYPWALDDSNDWKAGRAGQELSREVGPDGESVIVVAYRYGGGSNTAFMEALQAVLRHYFED